MILGITGGTGCGKTTALEVFRQLGGTVIDCDAVYHALLEQDTALLSAIEDRFPGTVENGILLRKKLGQLVFSDPQALAALNKITHTAILKKVTELLRTATGAVAIDAIGLFESGLSDLCDTTVAVTAPEDVRIARLMARDGISEEYAKLRIAAQPTQGVFAGQCNYVLENDGSESEFRQKCLAFFTHLDIMKV